MQGSPKKYEVRLADQLIAQVCYTPWANLRKEERMDVGTIGFHDEKLRLLITVEKDKEEIKRVSKTKTEAFPDLAADREERDVSHTDAFQLSFYLTLRPPGEGESSQEGGGAQQKGSREASRTG